MGIRHLRLQRRRSPARRRLRLAKRLLLLGQRLSLLGQLRLQRLFLLDGSLRLRPLPRAMSDYAAAGFPTGYNSKQTWFGIS